MCIANVYNIILYIMRYTRYIQQMYTHFTFLMVNCEPSIRSVIHASTFIHFTCTRLKVKLVFLTPLNIFISANGINKPFKIFNWQFWQLFTKNEFDVHFYDFGWLIVVAILNAYNILQLAFPMFFFLNLTNSHSLQMY